MSTRKKGPVTKREQVATLSILGLISLALAGMFYFGFIHDTSPQPVVLDPIVAIADDIDEILSGGNAEVIWCEGFASGVVMKQWVDAIVNDTPYTFPSEDFWREAADGCVVRGLFFDPFPRGEVVVPEPTDSGGGSPPQSK